MEKPYTIQEMKLKQNENGYVTGYVAVPLSDIIDNNLDQFLNIIAEKLVANECLMDIDYKAVGITNVNCGDASIIIKVTGDISEILSMEESEE